MYFFPRQEKKPFVPPNSVLLNNNNPFDEYDIRQQQQIKKQEMEKEKFMNEIKEFEERHDPYEILNIPRTANKSEVTKAYKKLSLYHHPDKGGKEELFNILTKAYNTIIKRIEFNKAKKKIEHDDLKKGAKSYYKKLDVNQKQDFDINKFNRTFSENKISDVNDKGYGDWNSEIKNENIQGNITKSNFNDMFNQSRKTNDYSKQIINYEEPVAMASGDLGFSELGQDNIDNFTRSESDGNGLEYTDYKNAYTINSKLIDTEQMTLDRPISVNAMKQDRENVSYNMSDTMKRQLEQKQLQEEQKEFDRLQRVNLFDETAKEHYDRMNKLMLGR